MVKRKSPHITVLKPQNGSGVEQMCSALVSHARTTGHGINDVVAELAWQWFQSSQPSADGDGNG